MYRIKEVHNNAVTIEAIEASDPARGVESHKVKSLLFLFSNNQYEKIHKEKKILIR